MLDSVPNVRLLLAHCGGTLPYLAGRLDSCVKAEQNLISKLKKTPIEYLKNFYYDAITYEAHSLQCCLTLVGEDRIVFGTDHPFFPPIMEMNKDNKHLLDTILWPSATRNQDSIAKLDSKVVNKICRQNAVKILDLPIAKHKI